MRERPRQAQARTSLLHLPPPCRTYLDSFFWELPTEIQISFPFFSRSSLVPLSSSSFPPSLLPPFLLFLPGKDNQVYVKYVCSFDSRQYLINSITPSTIVPKVFEMRTRQGGLFKSCQSMLTFFQLLPWLGPEFMKTENISQQNKNKDLFEIGLFKRTSTMHKNTRSKCRQVWTLQRGRERVREKSIWKPNRRHKNLTREGSGKNLMNRAPEGL